MGLGSTFYKKQLIHRWEEEPFKRYFKYYEFEGLHEEKYSFTSKGYTLNGGFYYHKGYNEDHIVIFCHGIGGGYSSYMSEIAMIAKAGLKVLSFDYIGCCNSEGKTSISMCESLVNLDACIKSLKENPSYKDKKISVVGHSWGGYAASNIANFHDDLNAIVDISGFISIDKLLEMSMGGPLKIFRKDVKKYETKMNPDFVNSCAIDAFNKTSARVLVIHDKLDNMVQYNYNTKLLEENVTNPNVKFIITEGKYHQPQYSMEANKYMHKVFGEFETELKNKKLKTLDEKKKFFKDTDWRFMTQMDEELFREIVKTIVGE